MKITRDTAYREQLLENQRVRMGIGVRRTGVHVSDLVFCVRKAQQERQAQFAEDVTDETILTWLRGLSHEALLADGIEQVRSGFCFQCMKNRPWTPELALDSKCPDCGDELLVGTIDWVTVEGINEEAQTIDNFIPVEMKSTLKSSRKTLEDGDMAWFIDQIKSYMFMHGRKEGRVAILHVMGDYSRGNPDIKSAGPKADLRVYKIAWDSDDEAIAWGQELQWSKEDVEGDVLPDLNERSPRHDFICEYCVIGKRLPTTGEPCEKYPWTQDDIRKGSALAGSMTADSLDQMLRDLDGLVDATTTTVAPQPAPVLTPEEVKRAAHELTLQRTLHEIERATIYEELKRELQRQVERYQRDSAIADPNIVRAAGSSKGSAPGTSGSTTGGDVQPGTDADPTVQH